MNEAAAIRQGSGLWSDSTLPRAGWRCVGMMDLGSPTRICDLCQSSRIRYAHCLRHDLTGRSLVAGCVCAGHLIGNPKAAASNDAWLRGIEARRVTWVTRKWRRSRQGNPFLRTDGYVVTLFQAPHGWSAVVKRRDTADAGVFQESHSPSLHDAKHIAFELLTRVQLRDRTTAPALRDACRVRRHGVDQPAAALNGWVSQLLSRVSGIIKRVA